MTRTRILIALVLAASSLPGAPNASFISVDLKDIANTTVLSASPVFVSDNALALLIRRKPVSTSSIFLFGIQDGQAHILSSVRKVDEGDRIFSVSGGRVILVTVRQKYMYSRDLEQRWEIPSRFIAQPFPGTDLVPAAGPDGVSIARLTEPPQIVEYGGFGQLIAVSSQALVFRSGKDIITLSPGRTVEGSFREPGSADGSAFIEVAGRDRLYIPGIGRERISDANGQTVFRIHAPEGWGWRHGWNADGTRLLFDMYLPDPSFSEKIKTFLDDLTGVYLPHESIGEAVSVLETSTGSICFESRSPAALFGMPGEYHADISPSGEMVAIATTERLLVYRLPTTCRVK